jgi:hypothetical protein
MNLLQNKEYYHCNPRSQCQQWMLLTNVAADGTTMISNMVKDVASGTSPDTSGGGTLNASTASAGIGMVSRIDLL